MNSGKKNPELLANNFKKIAEAFNGVPGAEAPKLRFNALYHIYTAIDRMMDGDIKTAALHIKSGEDALHKAKEAPLKIPSTFQWCLPLRKSCR